MQAKLPNTVHLKKQILLYIPYIYQYTLYLHEQFTQFLDALLLGSTFFILGSFIDSLETV